MSRPANAASAAANSSAASAATNSPALKRHTAAFNVGSVSIVKPNKKRYNPEVNQDRRPGSNYNNTLATQPNVAEANPAANVAQPNVAEANPAANVAQTVANGTPQLKRARLFEGGRRRSHRRKRSSHCKSHRKSHHKRKSHRRKSHHKRKTHRR
jgi:hypothetical protein